MTLSNFCCFMVPRRYGTVSSILFPNIQGIYSDEGFQYQRGLRGKKPNSRLPEPQNPKPGFFAITFSAMRIRTQDVRMRILSEA